MKNLLSIAKQIDNINKAIAVIARWSILLMLGLGLWNVIGRYLGVAIGQNLSSNRLIEGQWYLFDLAFLLGLSWTLQRQGHVRVDVLHGQWSKHRQIQLELLGTFLLLLPFAFGVMAISIEPTLQSWSIGESSPDPDGLPRYWVKTLIPISFFLLSLQGISKIIKKSAELKTQSETSKRKEKTVD